MKPDLPGSRQLTPELAPLRTDAKLSGRPPRPRCVQSDALFGQSSELLIEHAGFTYRLRITQANKLILTK